MAEAWTGWEGQIAGGVYPLRRFLHASDHSAVFLTESTTEGFLNAAIKLLPADPARTDIQLWQWKTAATFSHPHLMRLLDSGQCEIEGRPLLFVVMEYAEETLAQVLPYRALAPDEARELLVPTLDALAFLHRENWVQGQLKPTNFLVVNEQLKLAVDTIRPAAAGGDKATRRTAYDPPEIERGEISPAADIWALGVTLVEALTQNPPTWPQGWAGPPKLPTNLPPPFGEIIQRCLNTAPAERPSVADLQLQTRPPAAPEPVASAPVEPASTTSITRPERPASQPEPVMRANEPPHTYSASSRYSTRSESGKRNVGRHAIAAILVVFVAVWGGSRMFHKQSGHPSPVTPRVESSAPVPPVSQHPQSPSPPRQSAAGQPAPQQFAAQRSASRQPAPEQPTAQPSPASPTAAVVHEEIPKVSLSSRQTIQGHVRVTIRVTVDRSGGVIRDVLEDASSSRYFNRVASEAARKWEFAAIDRDRPRQWLLHFEFGREGTTVRATQPR